MNYPTKPIYTIGGLGTDEKVFERLHVIGYSLKHLHWIAPHKKESLQSYALRMAEKIKEPNPVLVGLSFGGMLAIEIAKQRQVQKIILISSVKTYTEIPAWMRLAGKLKLNKIIPIQFSRLTEKANDRRMGIQTPEEKAFVDYYRKHADLKQAAWAVNQIVNWRNTWVPETIYHIHGDNDRMFPLKNTQPTHIIKEGTHIMILNRAKEISHCIEQILSQ
jgi:pimeloyl-ACP methyl ester carboxylesterase